MEYITIVKHEIIPMCRRVIDQLGEEDDRGFDVASQHLQTLDNFQFVVKDALAVLSTEGVHTR